MDRKIVTDSMNLRPDDRTDAGSSSMGLLNAKQKWTRRAREMIPATQTDTTYTFSLVGL